MPDNVMRDAVVVILFAGISFGQAANGPKQQELAPDTSRPTNRTNTMDEIYRDESHCLTSPEIRSDKDAPISCYCRDTIAEARYVYFTYLLSGKDRNLNGVFLALERQATEECGQDYSGISPKTQEKEWEWDGPEVVRTYPSDEVIERISPEKRDGKPTGRWVPFTVQLVYRDAQGHVTRTENYSSREFEPVFPKNGRTQKN